MPTGCRPIEPTRSATYVTGGHSVKGGYQGVLHINMSNPFTNNHNLQYRFNNGVPNQLTQNLLPYRTEERTRYDALFIQDQWTRGRMTLQGALRYDHAWSYYPAQQIGPTRFLPQGLSVPDTKGVLGYHDISPRMGVAYDIFGDGKTAMKLHTGRYLEAAVNGNGNYSELRPINRISNSVTRTWTDANRNYEPDCDLITAWRRTCGPTGGDFCGAWSNANFGKEVPVLSYDEQILKGWYNRPSDWQITATVQQEVISSRVGGSRVHPSLAPELHRDRQPRRRAVGLHGVQRDCAERSASSRRWRVRRLGTLQREPRQVQCGRPIPDLRAGLRECVAGVQRRGLQRERAPARWVDRCRAARAPASR